MNIILFDDETRSELLPLVYTRPVADLRIGILTIREKWEKYLKTTSSTLTQEYLQNSYPLQKEVDNILINGSVLPNKELVTTVLNLALNEKLVEGSVLVAARLDNENLEEIISKSIPISKVDVIKKTCEYKFDKINHLWDIFQKNDAELSTDYESITRGRTSQPISSTNQVIGSQVFIEEGGKVECSILNSSTGPIYIGKNAEIMEGSVVRGALALCANSTLKLGTKIYGATTIGPHSKVGGEVNNSVIIGYSNKGHDGFLGNSVIGEWCNLGADTNTSNLKNNYGEVKVWNYPQQKLVGSGEQFCGLIMGDHSKSGINTMFNTGTVVGVCSNVFGGEFPEKFISSFSWGGAAGFTDFKIEKAFEVASRVMQRRGIKLTLENKKVLKWINNYAKQFK